jgi:glutamate synthase domain-containing protein 3
VDIDARDLDFKTLNALIKATEGDVTVNNCYGQRFIGSGLGRKSLEINGVPGNALGAYLDGGSIVVNGNAQDAVGDTMNDGRIIIHGGAGDALGYGMRGGAIYVRDNAGYRTGIHMKEYMDKKPLIVIGGSAGSFLGEYLAGGLIVVLGIGASVAPVGYFTGTGIHGGRIYIRTDAELSGLPAQVEAGIASADELDEIAPFVRTYGECFKADAGALLNDRFYILKPNAKNPYKRLYVEN